MKNSNVYVRYFMSCNNLKENDVTSLLARVAVVDHDDPCVVDRDPSCLLAYRGDLARVFLRDRQPA